MKTLNTLAIVGLVVTAASLAFAATAGHKSKPAAKPAVLACPVTGEKIASVKDAAGSSTYKGKTYYFCCPSCKPDFDANPAKYTKPAAAHKHMM